MFKNNLKLYVYPLKDPRSGELTTIDNLPVATELKKLYGYLAERGSFVALDNFNPDYLSIFSRDVLKKIAEGNEAWKDMVPDGVSDLIVKRRFFGCHG
ncbi:MAG: hypothetical protein EOP85_09450 [Verrucomicrobiaceae bacterium]|nr:MAG: hypothetical protein EOP85_09450 [Verrucomicrobiaceae bacterium]